MNKIKQIPFHPLFFALYPVLFLYTHNINMLQIHHIYRSIFFIIILSILVWFVLHLILRHPLKSALLATFSLVLFFSYGHVLSLLGNFSERLFGIQRDIYLSVHYFALWVVVVLLITQAKTVNIRIANQFANILGIILLILPTFSFLTHAQTNTSIKKDELFYKIEQYVDLSGTPESLPDIYYIIPDGYARQDVLEDLYDHDNSEFYSNLKKRGFLIAGKSNSNYAQTMLSLGSTLNLHYIQDIFPDIDMYSSDREPLAELISDNLVARLLRHFGYEYIVFSSGYSGTEIPDADVYMAPSISMNEFENMIIETTPVGNIGDALQFKSQHELHIDRIKYTFNELPYVSSDNSPSFIFVPLVIPHPPFVFNEEGVVDEFPIGFTYSDGSHYHGFDKTIQQEYKNGYVGQIQYVNKKILTTIDNIINNSNIPPIIILQADHGPGMMLHWEKPEKTDYRERLGILNAYYVNDEMKDMLYDSITPVNTFRLLFNSYFNASFPLLEDKSYFSRWSLPYYFIEKSDSVTNSENMFDVTMGK